MTTTREKYKLVIFIMKRESHTASYNTKYKEEESYILYLDVDSLFSAFTFTRLVITYIHR